jgi:FkbM family methyltransferase
MNVSDLRQERRRGPRWLGRMLAHRHVVPLTALLLRALTVRRPLQFIAREVLRRRALSTYRLRGTQMSVLVRHGTGDPVTLGEVFHERDYEPPAGAISDPPSTIVDLGANVGYFGAFAFTEWPEASVVAYEPDPDNAEVHSRVISLNGLSDRWELRRVAAMTAKGTVRFHARGDALSHAGEGGKLVVQAEDVLPVIGGVDLLKMDIEGGEWPILEDPRFSTFPPRTLVLEYHPRGPSDSDPHGEVRRLTHRAGLTQTATIFRRDDGHGMLWAWRE